jgi:PRTRC genetic system ThiF family protein
VQPLNLDFLEAANLRLIERDSISLVLVGCGGSGSWLAPTVVRTARLLIEKFGKTVRVVFIDPDTVEPKNCYRQNFAEFEVGRNKAECLALRYGLAWGVDVLALPQAFDADLDTLLNDERQTYYGLSVVIGCVDNAKARSEIHRYLTEKAGYGSARWWLDCGNDKHSGQVLVGGFNNKLDTTVFPLPDYCVRLPLPSEQHPELLIPGTAEPEPDAALSCADLALRGAQGLAVNQMVAAIAGDYLLRMLVYRGSLSHFQTYFDQTSGSMRSTPITARILQRYSGGSAELVEEDNEQFE